MMQMVWRKMHDGTFNLFLGNCVIRNVDVQFCELSLHIKDYSFDCISLCRISNLRSDKNILIKFDDGKFY